MEILVNELSLSGQFDTIEHFMEAGLRPFVKTLNDVDFQSNLLYKKYDFFQAKITSSHIIYEVLTGNISRQYDETRKFKSLLMKLLDNPYWENNSKQSANSVYTYSGNNICGSSLSEATERDRIVISFSHNDFIFSKLSVYKNDNEIEVDNLFERGHFPHVAYLRNYIAFDAFRKFSELSWQQIFMDDALDYKEYHNKKHFKNIGEKIFKFRISQKYRCFGYVSDSVFFVLKFDLEHKLSDTN